MTASPGTPASPDRPEGGTRAALDRELPTWTELADALYLAACQDAAVPLFDVPGREARERGERLRRENRPGDRPAPRDRHDSPGPGEPRPPGDPGGDPAGRSAAPEDQDGTPPGPEDATGDRHPAGETPAPGDSRTPDDASRTPDGDSRTPDDDSRTPHGDSRTPDDDSRTSEAQDDGLASEDELLLLEEGLTTLADAARPLFAALPAARPAGLRTRPAPHADAWSTGQAGWPTSTRLADSLALGRSLRPLRLFIASPHELELDEEATAEQAALAGVWTPVCRPVPERRLDLLLLVDDSPSMAMWSHTARQIAELMEQTAAFRTVRRLRWDPDDGDAATAGLAAAELGSGDRQLLLAVTDGGHSAWRTGRAAALLHRLGRHSPVAVLSLLPQHLWDLTLPTVTRTRLRASAPAAPNRSYDAEWKHPHADPLGPEPEFAPHPGLGTAIPVPVVELRPKSLSRWARLVAAAGSGEWHGLAALWTAPDRDLRSAVIGPVPERLATIVAEPTHPESQRTTPRPADPRRTDPPRPAEPRRAGAGADESPAVRRARRAATMVRRFRATASPAAYALAQRLAAAPLNLPVMRLLQQAQPGARFWNLAEIVLLGLVRRTDDTADVEDPHRVSFDFAEGVREELLALGSRAETIRALDEVRRHLGPVLEEVWGEGASALVAPEGDPADPPMTDETRPFVNHLYTALCAVSGPYLARANHLGRLLQRTAVPHQAGKVAADTAPTPGHKRPSGYSSVEMRSELNIAPTDALHYGPRTPQAPQPANAPQPAGNSPTAPSSAPVPPTQPSSSPTPTPSPAPASPPARPRQGGIAVTAGLPVATGPRSPHDPPRIWGNVPQRNRNFTGRETLLERLQERLSSGVTAVLPEALHGMGGVGKSQIAIEYVYRHSRDYRLIWWIPSEQENQIVQSLIELGEQMGLQAGSEMSAVPAVLDALRRGEPYRDWLLVFDNAENPKEVRKYFPNDGPGRIVVTSRNFQWSTDASSLEVDVFARDESVALLRRRSPQLPDDAVDHLAAALGDLPLAVEQAAVWLAETGMPVQQYLEVYERNFTELMQSEPPGDYPLSVAAAWNVSLGRLRETRPDALQLLQVCAFFAPEPIEWDLFSAVRGISVPQELQSALDDPVKLGRAVREIGRYALARIDHRQNTVQMHRLVQRVLIEQMNAQEQATMRHAAHQLLSHADPRNPERVTYWPRYSSLLTHVNASNAVECEEPWTRRLVLNEVWFLRARGDHAAALALGRRAAKIWRERLGEDHEEVLAVDQQIAQALLEQGNDRERAYTMQSSLVERFRTILGEAHENTLQAQSFLAVHHRNRGNFREAREMDQQVYETSLREFGADDPATLLAAHNYAVSLRLAGDSERARELDYDTWQRRIEALGEDHIYTLSTQNAYLLDLQEIGRYEESLDGYERLTEEVREQLGENHPLTAQISRNLCVTRRKKGDHKGAHALSSQLITLVSDLFGTSSRQYLQMAVSHATDLRQVGKLQESRVLNQQALDKHVDSYGREHPHSYAVAMNLAVVLRLLDQPEAALKLDQEAVEGLTRTLGQDHPRTLLARMNLASDHFALGRTQEACAIDEAVAEESARLRESHPANLAIQLNLSYDLKAVGRTEEGEAKYAESLKRYRSVLGPSHPATLDAEKGLRANADIDLISL
ncbi:FxSxx-COOH system tetratricopeptide repeat protein [Streptomyces sp. NPDC001292]|uniref:FxSxx-COOH system tetratricopeptide repeat protein n=1 Tax=Streptomyces sp. NPDC001292 TaxID=3364558 RepID=UPI0036C83E27